MFVLTELYFLSPPAPNIFRARWTLLEEKPRSPKAFKGTSLYVSLEQ